MVQGRLLMRLMSWTLVVLGVAISFSPSFALGKTLVGFGLALLGGLLYARLMYVAQKREGRDTWHS